MAVITTLESLVTALTLPPTPWSQITQLTSQSFINFKRNTEIKCLPHRLVMGIQLDCEFQGAGNLARGKEYMHYFSKRVHIFNQSFNGTLDSLKLIKLFIPHLVNLTVNHSLKNYLLSTYYYRVMFQALETQQQRNQTINRGIYILVRK